MLPSLACPVHASPRSPLASEWPSATSLLGSATATRPTRGSSFRIAASTLDSRFPGSERVDISDYLPATGLGSSLPGSSDFKLEQTFISSGSDSSSLSEDDIRLVVFQQSEKRGAPQPLFDSHRTIGRSVAQCGSQGSPRAGRRRASSARIIQTGSQSVDHAASGRCQTGTAGTAARQYSSGTATASSYRSIRTPGNPASTAAATAPSTKPLSLSSSHSVANSQSSSCASSIAQTLAASLTTLLSMPLKSLSSLDGKDKYIHSTSSSSSGIYPSAGPHHRPPPPPPTYAPRPTSPTLSVASRCSTPRNTESSVPSTNTWFSASRPSSSASPTMANSSAGNSPSTARPSDHKLLAEMVDSLPMRGCQASVKIHQLKNPARIMMTYNFTMYVRKQGRGSPTSDDSFCMSSCSSFGPESPASPRRPSLDFSAATVAGSHVNIPRAQSDQALARHDPQISGGRRRASTLAATEHPGPGAGYPVVQAEGVSSRAFTPGWPGQGSLGSRLTLGARTPSSSLSSVGSSGYNSYYNSVQLSGGSDGGWSQDEEPVPMKALRFAALILISSPSENSSLSSFLHSHWPLIMRHMLRVQDGIEDAVSSKLFLANSVTFRQAQQELRHKILRLWRTPRIESPAWLTLSTFEFARRQIGCKFICHFIRLAKECIASGQQTFLPTVLTAVLSHHVGWVKTAKDAMLRKSLTDDQLDYGSYGAGRAQQGQQQQQQQQQGQQQLGHRRPLSAEGSGFPPPTGQHQQQKNSTGAESLQQQMSESYGALCWPPQLARTIVVGQNVDSVALILHLLTYFIRCTDIIDTTADVSKECKDLTNTLMRPRTPGPRLEAAAQQPSASSRSNRPPHTSSSSTTGRTKIPSTPTKRCPTTAIATTTLRTPIAMESNMYQSNLDRFTVGDSTPTGSSYTPSGGNPGRSFASGATLLPDSSPSGSSAAERPALLSDKKPRREKPRPKELTLSTSSQSTTTTPRARTPKTIGRTCSSESSASVEEQTSTEQQPHQHDVRHATSAALPIAEQSAAVTSGDGSSSSHKSYGSLSMLSSSLQNHDAAKESASRQAHQCWLDWMGGLKAVDLHSPPGSPSAENKSLPGSAPSVYAPLHCNLGRSLLGGLCSEYQSDFVLHGTCQPHAEVLHEVNHDLKIDVQHSVLSRPVNGAVAVVINTDRMSCEVLSQARPPPDVTTPSLATGKQLLESRAAAEPSLMIAKLLISVIGVWELNMSELMCMLHLEDGLRQIVLKSKMVSEYLSRQPPAQALDQRKLTALFGVDNSDMELLLSVNRVLWSPT